MAISDLLGQLVAGSYADQAPTSASIGQLAPTTLNSTPVQDLSGPVASPVYNHRQMVTGPLGSRGALGDILGYLGDAALVQMGLHPEYQTRKHNAALADAQEGFETDPMGAIGRMTAVDPGTARDMLQQLMVNRYHQQITQASADQDARAAALAPIQQQVAREKLFAPAASMAMAATQDKTGKSWPTVYNRISSYLTTRGLGDHLEGLSEKSTPAEIAQWASSGISPDKQVDNSRQQDALNETEDYHDKSIGLRGEEVRNQTRNVDDEIGYRAWQRVHGDKTANTAADEAKGKDEYRRWLMTHPSTDRVLGASILEGDGPAAAGPPPPRHPGDKIRSPNGKILTSKDGKNWDK